ncbi:hypothetical protein ACTRXA_06855 [Nitrospina sp. P1_D6]
MPEFAGFEWLVVEEIEAKIDDADSVIAELTELHPGSKVLPDFQMPQVGLLGFPFTILVFLGEQLVCLTFRIQVIQVEYLVRIHNLFVPFRHRGGRHPVFLRT